MGVYDENRRLDDFLRREAERKKREEEKRKRNIAESTNFDTENSFSPKVSNGGIIKPKFNSITEIHDAQKTQKKLIDDLRKKQWDDLSTGTDEIQIINTQNVVKAKQELKDLDDELTAAVGLGSDGYWNENRKLDDLVHGFGQQPTKGDDEQLNGQEDGSSNSFSKFIFKWDGSYIAKLYACVYYTNVIINGKEYVKMDKVEGGIYSRDGDGNSVGNGVYIIDNDLSIGQIGKLGSKGKYEQNRHFEFSNDKRSFTVYPDASWQPVVNEKDLFSKVGCTHSVTLQRGYSNWDVVLENHI